MFPARRITALLASLLLAHASWVGTGFTCSMPGLEGNAKSAASMTDMNMSSAEMADMDMSAASDQPADAPMHDHESCELPWAPNGCQSMGACAPLALASLSDVVRTRANPPLRVASRVTLTPPSEVRAPELPPPRA